MASCVKAQELAHEHGFPPPPTAAQLAAWTTLNEAIVLVSLRVSAVHRDGMTVHDIHGPRAGSRPQALQILPGG